LPNQEVDRLENSEAISFKLDDLGLNVSTGPVVDFRSKEFIYLLPNESTVPLLYPTHFNGKEISWPKSGKKPNAIQLNETTKKMLYPSGYYTLVKRFTTNEEKQRVVARVINPTKLQSNFIGIENHINVFHSKKEGISKNLAYGLAAYLNSSLVDKYFRTFNGHTQVNATDLKQMNYPSLTTLTTLGKWARKIKSFDPKVIDKKILQFL
jgi:adenine-specific DNA-methyltransferase